LLEDDPQSGRPSDAVNPSAIAAVETLTRDYRRIKVLKIARTMQILRESLETIFHDPSGDVEGVCKIGPEEFDRSWSCATRHYI